MMLYRDHDVLVDDEHLDLLLDGGWGVYAFYHKKFKYLTRSRGRTEYFHRVITNAPAGVQVDHINKNTLDNRLENLRLVTPRGNMLNSSKVVASGIDWHKERWRARLRMPDGRRIEKSFNDRGDAEAWWAERHAERAQVVWPEQVEGPILAVVPSIFSY